MGRPGTIDMNLPSKVSFEVEEKIQPIKFALKLRKWIKKMQEKQNKEFIKAYDKKVEELLQPKKKNVTFEARR